MRKGESKTPLAALGELMLRVLRHATHAVDRRVPKAEGVKNEFQSTRASLKIRLESSEGSNFDQNFLQE